MAAERLQARAIPTTPEESWPPNGELPPKKLQTPLGRRLWEIRTRIRAAGEPLLSWDDLGKEVAERTRDMRE